MLTAQSLHQVANGNRWPSSIYVNRGIAQHLADQLIADYQPADGIKFSASCIHPRIHRVRIESVVRFSRRCTPSLQQVVRALSKKLVLRSKFGPLFTFSAKRPLHSVDEKRWILP